MYRTANYAAFYVAEPFPESNLKAFASKDFCYYQLLKKWKAEDYSFPFVDAHAKTYNVRDDSDWETTLKPRLHQRLKLSKNVILFLSSYTKNSRALREEINYAINELRLPIIIVYPEISTTFGIHYTYSFSSQVVNLWEKIPELNNNKWKVPVLHVPMSKERIREALSNPNFTIQHKTNADDYYY